MMLFGRTAARYVFVTVGALAMLTGCATTPLAPTVQVTPGRGKTPEQFSAEDTYCRKYAGDHVHDAVTAANSQAVTAMLTRDEDDDSPPVLGANQQGGIQAEYDRAYGWCMYSEHNVVPGYGARPVRTARPRKPATPTADKVSAPASASTWVAPTTASSGAAAGGSGSSGSGGAAATGWVQPAK